jgi:membrane-associated protease RseP (regulator of RpoE activity)
MDLLGWVIFIVALLVSVMLHETGHFVLAKKFGMKVTRYFVGFGPTIWSTWRGETEYGIKALPLGGFVKIVGMHSLDDPDDPADEARSFRSHPAWQRIAVLCAGSAMHFLLALGLIFGLALGVGIANDNTTQLGTVSSCVPKNVTQLDNGTCTASDAASPSKLAGLRVGDTVTAFDGKPVSNFTQLGNVIRDTPAGSPATITVRRGRDLRARGVMLREYPGHGVNNPGKANASRQEGGHAGLVGGVVGGRHGAAGRGRLPGQRDRGERLVIEGLEGPGRRRRPVQPRRGVGDPFGPGQAQRDRQPHVRRGGHDDRRAVGVLHHRVHDRLRVHHHVDPVQPEAEQQVRLDHFQALVHQRRGVHRDQRPHLPGRVGQGLLRRDVRESVPAPAAERSAARGLRCGGWC